MPVKFPKDFSSENSEVRLDFEREKKFHEIYNKYHVKIFNYIAKNIGNREDALDLLQEVFLLFYERLHRLDVSTDKIEYWLFRVARNLCLTYSRTQMRRLNKSLIEPEKLGSEISDKELQTLDLKNRIDQFLDSLNDQERCIFILHKFERVKYKDLMKIFEMSPRTLKRVVAAIITKMRQNKLFYPNLT